MKAKHTQGPWIVSQCIPESSEYARIVKNAEGEHIAHIVDFDFDYLPEVRANAHLIAAAPELLAALEGMLNATRTGKSIDIIADIARAAIAKARGES